ncbi:MAG: DUF986 family protein [Arsenophonus sp. NC-WZS1-MAG3]
MSLFLWMLIAIIVNNNIIQHCSSQLTIYLLIIIVIVSVYLTLIRYSKLSFKEKILLQ